MPGFDSREFQKDVLECQNKIRKDHGAPPLEMDEDLNKLAEKMAFEMCKNENPTTNETLKGIGQLIVVLEGEEPTGEGILNNLYESEATYDFSLNECPEGSRHLAQVIWVDSHKFGCGISSSEEGKHYIMFMYKPAGNFLGYYKYNVFPKGTPLMKRHLHTSKPIDSAPDGDQLRKEMIKFHNECRTVHNAPELVWDSSVADAAKELATQLLKDKMNGTKVSTSSKKYGRNTLVVTGLIPSVATCCKRWYSSSSDYAYDQNVFQVNSTSFCQMVWYDTKRMGAAYAIDGDYCVVVALYSPTGNVSNGYKRNVSKPNGKIPTFEES